MCKLGVHRPLIRNGKRQCVFCGAVEADPEDARVWDEVLKIEKTAERIRMAALLPTPAEIQGLGLRFGDVSEDED